MTIQSIDKMVEIQERTSRLLRNDALETASYETLHEEFSEMFAMIPLVPDQPYRERSSNVAGFNAMLALVEEFLYRHELDASASIPDAYWRVFGELFEYITDEYWRFVYFSSNTRFFTYYAKMCPPCYLGDRLDDLRELYASLLDRYHNFSPDEDTEKHLVLESIKDVGDAYGGAMLNKAIYEWPRSTRQQHASDAGNNTAVAHGEPNNKPHDKLHDELTEHLAACLAELNEGILVNIVSHYPVSSGLFEALSRTDQLGEAFGKQLEPSKEGPRIESLLVAAPYARRIVEEKLNDHPVEYLAMIKQVRDTAGIEPTLDWVNPTFGLICGKYRCVCKCLVPIVLRDGSDAAAYRFEMYLKNDVPFEDIIQ